MSENRKEIVAQTDRNDSAVRREWQRPEFRKLEASAAEADGGATNDLALGLS